MSKHVWAATLAATLAAAAPAAAFQFNGAEIEAGYSAFFDDTDFSRTSLHGSAEFGFNRNVAVQLDFSHYDFDFINQDAQTYTVHGIFHASERTSFGLFGGTDDASGGDQSFYGIEIGHELSEFEFEAYLSRTENDDTLLGLSGRHPIAPKVTLGASFDHIEPDIGPSLTRFGVKTDYRVSGNFEIFAELGTARASGGGSEGFFALGGRITFGDQRGTTFGRRGVLDKIPGL